MLKIIPFLASLLLLTSSAYTDNSEAIFEEEFTISDVRHVAIETPGELVIRPGTEGLLTVEAKPDVLRQLDIMMQKDTLFLGSTNSFNAHHKIRYVLEIPRLQSLSVRGSARAVIGPFQGEAFDIELGGNGSASINNIEFDRLTLRVSGTGSIDVSGRGGKLVAMIDGSGKVGAENLEVTYAEAHVSGTGNLNVNARKRLSVVVTDAGIVRYKGRPEINQSVSGAGSLRPL